MGSRPCPPPWLPSPERGAQRGEEPGGDRGSERSRDPGEELRERGSEAEVGRRGTVACPAGWLGGCPFPAPAYQGRSDRQHLGGSHGPTSLPSPWPPAALASPPRGAEACACRFRPRPDSPGSGPGSGPGSATPAVWPGRVAPHLWGWRVKWHSGTGLASPGLDRNWQGTGPSVLLLPQQVNKERGEAEQGPEVQGLPQLFR